MAQDPVRIFITDSQSWETSGGFGVDRGTGGGGFAGGARPQTVEVMKTFRERCPEYVITSDKTKARFVILLDREGGKDLVRRDNKIAVFHNGGDLLFAGSTRSLGNAVKNACGVIQQELGKAPATPAPAQQVSGWRPNGE